jgi:hypothetical protein
MPAGTVTSRNQWENGGVDFRVPEGQGNLYTRVPFVSIVTFMLWLINVAIYRRWNVIASSGSKRGSRVLATGSTMSEARSAGWKYEMEG